MEAKHTPGPWVFCTDDAGWDRITIEQDRAGMPVGEEPSVVGEVYDGGDGIDRATAEANARLIAAAPDLLAALRKALEWVEHVEAVAWDSIPEDMRGDNGAAWAIRSALARATGGAR